MKYLNESDLPMLKSTGWETGMSGWSWFKADKTGQEWQAFLDDADMLMFANNIRATSYLTREAFEEIFDAVT